MPRLHPFLSRLGDAQVEGTEDDDASQRRGLGVYDRPEQTGVSLRIIIGTVLLILLVMLTLFLMQQIW